MGGLLASVPYFPIDLKTVIPENVVKYFQSLNHEEGLRGGANIDMNIGNSNVNGNGTQKRGFQSFTENVGLRITTGRAEKRRLTQEESMNRFRQRYPISPKPHHKSLTLNLQTKGAIKNESPPQQHETETPPSRNPSYPFRGSRTQAHTPSPVQPSLSIPSLEDSKFRESLELRVHFEEASLAEIERLMEVEGGLSAWHQHLSEKAANYRGKLQAYQGALNTLPV
jgi:hypothetical protein